MLISAMTGFEILRDIKYGVLDRSEFTVADMLEETEKLVSMDAGELKREEALDIMHIYSIIRDCRERKIKEVIALNTIVEIMSKYNF